LGFNLVGCSKATKRLVKLTYQGKLALTLPVLKGIWGNLGDWKPFKKQFFQIKGFTFLVKDKGLRNFGGKKTHMEIRQRVCERN